MNRTGSKQRRRFGSVDPKEWLRESAARFEPVRQFGSVFAMGANASRLRAARKQLT